MSQAPLPAPTQGAPAGRMGVLEAAGMGWRLMMGDFWRLWLAALVALAVLMAANSFGVIAAILVMPPLLAGLYYIVGRRIDGGPADVGDLFKGFSERFSQSVVGFLPLLAGGFVVGALIAALVMVDFMLVAGIAAACEGNDEIVIAAVIIGVAIFLPLFMVFVLAIQVFGLFFTFVPAAVWDHAESGWEAFRASARLVWGHIVSMIGLVLLFWLIGTAASLIGMATCCVGYLFTTPAVMAWEAATILYLYRSWAKQPLVRPPGPGANPYEPGPVAPASIEPPAT